MVTERKAKHVSYGGKMLRICDVTRTLVFVWFFYKTNFTSIMKFFITRFGQQIPSKCLYFGFLLCNPMKGISD